MSSKSTTPHDDKDRANELPYPDSGWLPGLQRTIKHKLTIGEIDEVDADVFHGMMGQITQEKDDKKKS